MFTKKFLKHTTITQLFTTAGVAVLIYIYAAAQGFTLPMHFESPHRQGSSGQAKPTQPTLSTKTKPTATPTPTNIPFSNLNSQIESSKPTNSVMPAAAALHASERAQEVANVPQHAIENTQQALTNIATKTLEKAEEKLLK